MRDFLFDFKEFNGVLLGDNRECAIRGGQGIFKEKFDISGHSDREGYTVKLQNGRAKVIKGSLMVMSGTVKGNCVYSLDGWAESGLHELEKREVLGSKGLGKLKFCQNCVLGKSTTVSFGQGQHTTDGVIDYVHADPWGPSWVESISGCRSPSTALEKKTPMDLWSRHLANYEMLSNHRCVAYSHMNQGKLKPRAIKCIFMRYPDGVKGYKLWRLNDVKPKIIISRDVVFNKSLMYKDTLKGTGAADSGKKVKFEVKLQGSRVEPTMDPHTGENLRNKDEEQDEGPQQQNLDNYVLVCDRAKRITTIPTRYMDEGNEEDTHDPITFQETINSSEKDECVRAMEEEMSSLKKNHTWELGEQSPGQKLISYKLFYKIKEGIKCVQKRRFSCSNYDSCVYFKEFAPGMYIYLLLYVDDMLIACKSKSEIEYTKGLLRKEFDMMELGPARKLVFGESRYSFVDVYYAKNPNKGRSITGYVFMVHGCVVSWKATLQHVVALSTTYSEYMVLTEAVKESIWLKGLLIELGVNLREIVESKEIEVAKIGTEDNAADAFTKMVPGPKFKQPPGFEEGTGNKVCLLKKPLYGLKQSQRQWDRGSQNLKVSQSGYVQKTLNSYRVDNGKLDIVYVVSIVTLSAGIWRIQKSRKVRRYSFVDVDYAKNPNKGRSITGFVFMVHGYVVSWKATLQHVVALSTTYSEYMVLTEAVKESIWLKGLLIELGVNLRSVVVNCDNQGAIHLSRNAMFYERTKHINVRYHFIWEIVESKEIEVAKIGTKDNAADAFTKVVPGPKFKYCIEILGVGIN
nr:retrovirus-related Pol polyprotein from transposon TNT 1-94 [Tanacetum cinerariifolium]